jgi:hypothetical protein
MTIPLDKTGCPDLQALIERAGRRYAASIGEAYIEDAFKRPPHQGGYPHVTPEEWAEFDRQTAEWQARQRSREGAPTEQHRNELGKIPHLQSASADVERSDPERLCICGLPGVVSRPRKGDGRRIWRCEQHRNRWPDYATIATIAGA